MSRRVLRLLQSDVMPCPTQEAGFVGIMEPESRSAGAGALAFDFGFKPVNENNNIREQKHECEKAV